MRIASTENILNSEGKPGKINLVNNKLALPIASILLFLVILAGFIIVKPKINLPFMSSSKSGGEGINASGYQAVFLVNGQVYFGKLRGFSSNEPTLTGVYYLQMGTNLQPGEASKQQAVTVEKETAKSKAAKKAATAKEATPTAAPRSNLTLVKMGTEVHGPTGELTLNRDQILYVENLRDDSQVVQAIKRYEASSLK